MLDPLNLTRRTRGEELWLQRHREGLSQAEMADRLRVSRTQLWALETGLATPKKPRRPAPTPSRTDLLRLARRRSGLRAQDVADGLGVSRVTLYAWESRADPRLTAFWALRGFTFVQK